MLHARECQLSDSTGPLGLGRVSVGSFMFQRNQNAWKCSARARCLAIAAAGILDMTVACRHFRVEMVKDFQA